jgi:choline dehydrogenase
MARSSLPSASNLQDPTYNRFDFIVIGGGTAGNTVAGRLAENPAVRVLVIEAGAGNPTEIPEVMTPSAAMSLRGSSYDWAYKATMVKRDDYERIEKPNTRGKVSCTLPGWDEVMHLW